MFSQIGSLGHITVSRPLSTHSLRADGVALFDTGDCSMAVEYEAGFVPLRLFESISAPIFSIQNPPETDSNKVAPTVFMLVTFCCLFLLVGDNLEISTTFAPE